MGIDCVNLNRVKPSDLDHWVFNNNTIDYCLVDSSGLGKAETESCNLQCTPHIMLGKDYII
jgi:hypothetical protein